MNAELMLLFGEMFGVEWKDKVRGLCIPRGGVEVEVPRGDTTVTI